MHMHKSIHRIRLLILTSNFHIETYETDRTMFVQNKFLLEGLAFSNIAVATFD